MRATASLFSILSILAFSNVLASTPNTRACTNAISNPSFESSLLSPWTSSATGSWARRSVLKAPAFANAHSGAYLFHGQSNSTNASTITLSQTDIHIPAGRKVECSAWVYVGGDMGERGRVGFDVFLDGMWCGAAEVRAGGKGGWRRIAKAVVVQGDVHMLAIVAMADAMGEMGAGIEVGIDDVWVGWC